MVLKELCEDVWGIDVPTDEYIRDYNKKAKSFK